MGFKYLNTVRFVYGGSDDKASAYNVGDLGLIPGLGRSPGEGYSTTLQYSCLENPMDGGAWLATVHGVAKSWTRLSDFTFLYPQYNEACNDTNIKGLGSFAMNLKENFSCTKDVYNVNSLSLKMNSLSMLCQLLSIK